MASLRPFANGSQYLDWEEANCVRCAKYSDDGLGCPLMEALAIVCFGDGTIDVDTALRIGYLKYDGTTERRYGWPCNEVEWTEEWKAEWKAHHAR